MQNFKDTYQHKGLRKQLVSTLRDKGIKSEAVLSAIAKIPRHLFFEGAFLGWAYQDKAFPIGKGQTISQPFTVAYQTELLQVQKRDNILEIGTGSGYQAAVLAEMGARVYTIERQPQLHQKAKKLLTQLGYKGIRFYLKDGYLGLAELAPFQKIIVTAAAPSIPPKLKSQLAIEGRMVIPVGEASGQKMILLTRKSETEYQEEILGDFKFVPFVKGIAKD